MCEAGGGVGAVMSLVSCQCACVCGVCVWWVCMCLCGACVYVGVHSLRSMLNLPSA